MTLPPRPLDPRGKGLNYVLGECKVIVEFIIVKQWENLKLVTHFNSLEMYNSIYSFFQNSNVYKDQHFVCQILLYYIGFSLDSYNFNPKKRKTYCEKYDSVDRILIIWLM